MCKARNAALNKEVERRAKIQANVDRVLEEWHAAELAAESKHSLLIKTLLPGRKTNPRRVKYRILSNSNKHSNENSENNIWRRFSPS